MCSKTICYSNIPKIVCNEGSQCLCSGNMQKCSHQRRIASQSYTAKLPYKHHLPVYSPSHPCKRPCLLILHDIKDSNATSLLMTCSSEKYRKATKTGVKDLPTIHSCTLSYLPGVRTGATAVETGRWDDVVEECGERVELLLSK